jgi:sialate O-acetylesterase
MKNSFYMLLAALLCAACGQERRLSLPALFSDNMVLLRQSSVPIWGMAKSNASVCIQPSWTAQSYCGSAAADGSWKIAIPTPDAGGPHQLNIRCGADSITLSNVMTGEVWLCSGQSNMEMPMAGWGRVLNYEQEVAAANYPNIRLLQVENACNTQPQSDFAARAGGWQVCTPQAAEDFSSIGYFFARDIQESLQGVPIGVIDATWGGTVIEAWTSAAALKTHADFADRVSVIEKTDNAALAAEYDEKIKVWRRQFLALDKGMTAGKAAWAAADFDDEEWKVMPQPSHWENCCLPDYDGVVWFRTSVDIPQEWLDSDLTLSLGEIDDNDITYFNGEQAGAVDGYNIVRTYIIPARMVKAGKNTICVRITDTGGAGGFSGDAKDMYLAHPTQQKITLAKPWRYQTGVNAKDLPPLPASPSDPNRPSVLYNAMIAPIAGFPIRGALWYQGEANADRPVQYRALFPLLIKDWRSAWGSDFAFCYVQLASWQANSNGNWSKLREAQAMTLDVPNTGMAVAFDIGDERDIHPKNKQEAARRLALWVKAKTYGLPVASYSGPMLKKIKIEGNKIRISFDYADDGLKTSSGKPLGGFVIAGADGNFVEARAKIEGSEVVVWADSILRPAAARYGWTDTQCSANLCGAAGLPAAPFRTDRE